MDRIEPQAFWRWAHSDFLSHAERGLLAEYIVVTAVESTSTQRREWDAYDLETDVY